MEAREFITPQEIAEELRVTPGAVSGWLRKGMMRGIKVGKYWRVRPEDYLAFLNEQSNLPDPPARPEPTPALTSTDERLSSKDDSDSTGAEAG